jgi:hypothetical protein
MDQPGMTVEQQYAKLNILIEFQEAMSKRSTNAVETQLYRQTILFLRMQQTHLTKRILVNVG